MEYFYEGRKMEYDKTEKSIRNKAKRGRIIYKKEV